MCNALPSKNVSHDVIMSLIGFQRYQLISTPFCVSFQVKTKKTLKALSKVSQGVCGV